MLYYLSSLLLLLTQSACLLVADQVPLFDHAGSNSRNVTAALFQDLEEFARVVDIAYCVGSTSWGISKPFECLSRCKDFPTFELVSTWNTGPLLSDSCGYVALDHGKSRIIVAFRGTYSIANTIVDLSTVPQKYIPYPGEDDDSEGGAASQDVTKQILGGLSRHEKRTVSEPKCLNCSVHWGFQSSWLNTRRVIISDLQQQVFLHPEYEVNVVGHSLGGAVAALAALDFKARGWDPRVTTFGEPRIGNTGLVRYIDQRFNLSDDVPHDDMLRKYRRVTHAQDPVPLLPLTEWGYAMHGGEIFISKSNLSPDVQDLQHCEGDQDRSCIAGQDSTIVESYSDPSRFAGLDKPDADKRDLLASIEREVYEIQTEPWGIPSRYKLWQLLFAHRDYFWRIGLCVPGGDPLGGGSKYADV